MDPLVPLSPFRFLYEWGAALFVARDETGELVVFTTACRKADWSPILAGEPTPVEEYPAEPEHEEVQADTMRAARSLADAYEAEHGERPVNVPAA